MTIDIPLSPAEKWDELAAKVKKARGAWVVVAEYPSDRRDGRNQKAKEALERRGIVVEVKSRLGHNSKDRPWDGWRTWARVI